MSRCAVILRRARTVAPAVVAVTAALLTVRAAVPAPAHAVDLFPIDDWIGDGLKGVGKVVLGPLKLTAEGIAHLIGTIVAALADLLIPKSLVRAGVRAVRWLVELPPLGSSPSRPGGVPSLSMPHLRELRDTLTWIGLTLLPLQIVLAGGRAFLSPSTNTDSPAEVLQRTIAAALGLLAFDWAWGALTELVRLITSTLLGLPWVADGVRRMLQSLVVGGAGGTAVAAEFVVPLVLTVAGAVLLALMLLRIGLEVVASLVYVTGGLALGLSVSGAGHRLLQAWLVAAAAVFVLPVLWCVVFVTAAALMVDAGSGGGHGFGDFVGQLYNVGAAIVTFGIAIKLARATLGHAGTAITGLAATARLSGAALGGRSGSTLGMAAPSARTPKSLVRFSQQLRGGMRGAAVGVARAGTFPVRHPIQTAAFVRHPVQKAAAGSPYASSAKSGAAAAPLDTDARGTSRPGTDPGSGKRTGKGAAPTASGTDGRRPAATQPVPSSVAPQRMPRPDTPRHPPRPTVPPPAGEAAAGRKTAASETPAKQRVSVPEPSPRTTIGAGTARAWKSARRVVAPARKTARKTKPRRDRKRP